MLWGREDIFLPIERALVNVRGIRNAELRVVPDCGHWVQIEAREYFDHAVREFLDGDRP
jgi:4,5:9,10-diseco-3-hydroxy-5,9,17-trioxoandrosta-1(10),2-diene-4-oate hydrolase